jgi:hypothetical protein
VGVAAKALEAAVNVMVYLELFRMMFANILGL